MQDVSVRFYLRLFESVIRNKLLCLDVVPEKLNNTGVELATPITSSGQLGSVASQKVNTGDVQQKFSGTSASSYVLASHYE